MVKKTVGLTLGAILLISLIASCILFLNYRRHERIERDFQDFKLNGIVEFNKRQFADAVQQFVNALALKQKDVEVRTLIVSAYKRSGSYDLAEEFLLDSLEVLPQNPELLTQLGYVYLEAGNLEKSQKVFMNLVDAKIDLLEGYDGLAEVEVKKKNYDEAIQYFRKTKPFRDRLIDQAREKGKITRSFYRFASLLKETGNVELAEILFHRILKLEPLEINAYIELAQIYEYVKKRERAIYYYNAFLKIATTLDQEKIEFANQRIEALKRDEFLPPPPVIPLK